jgi:hypothetical protein
MRNMSLHRTLNRSRLNDLNFVAKNDISPERSEQQTAPIPWIGLRKILLPRTARWMATLPLDLQPTATGEALPGIANTLAVLWSSPEELTSYLDDLLTGKQWRRLGIPVRVLSELHALRAYHATLLPAREQVTSRRVSRGHAF